MVGAGNDGFDGIVVVQLERTKKEEMLVNMKIILQVK